MVNWGSLKLRDISDLKYGENLPSSALRSSGYPVYGANGIIGYHDSFNLNSPTVLVSCRGEYSGVINKTAGKVFVTNNSIPVRLNTDEIDTDYLFYALSIISKSKIISGSAQPQVTINDLQHVIIPKPRLSEQRGIATILHTADTIIEQTHSLIAKYNAIKQGMMQDLFARGLDQTGKLRPAFEDAPDQYKESEVGLIPKAWDVDFLINRISLPQGQVDPKTKPYCDWVLIAPDHIEKQTGRLIAKATASEQNAISGKYEFRTGDVVYSKIRPYLRKAILTTEPGICSADMYPMRASETIRPRFLLAVVLGESFSQFAESVSERSGFPKMNRIELAEYKTAFPPIHEQERICNLLDGIDRLAEAEDRSLTKFKLLKPGLMQDLLTGKVRVKVDGPTESTKNVGVPQS